MIHRPEDVSVRTHRRAIAQGDHHRHPAHTDTNHVNMPIRILHSKAPSVRSHPKRDHRRPSKTIDDNRRTCTKSYLGQADAVHALPPQHPLFHRVARRGHLFPVRRLSSREQSFIRQCLMGEVDHTAQGASFLAFKRTAALDTADHRVLRDHPSHPSRVLSSPSRRCFSICRRQ